jgi:uncharacterized protein
MASRLFPMSHFLRSARSSVHPIDALGPMGVAPAVPVAQVVVGEAVAAAVVVEEDAVAVGVESANATKDRFGLGWRPEIAGGIFDHLDCVDLLEVIADDFFEASSREIRALKYIASQAPMVLHGVGLGLGSATPVETKRLEKMARLVDQVRPEFWSEHLAMVRGGGLEIGHLAAPPRTTATVDGTRENLARAARIVGSMPWMENIATLIDPPGSTLSEPAWINSILDSIECGLLLDLHNVLANGLNHGYDPHDFLAQIPASRIDVIHIAGGKFITAPDGGIRLLDDHLHDVPEEVFDLLEAAAAISPNPLTVILERDGAYPSAPALIKQIQRARSSVARGRSRRVYQEALA